MISTTLRKERRNLDFRGDTSDLSYLLEYFLEMVENRHPITDTEREESDADE